MKVAYTVWSQWRAGYEKGGNICGARPLSWMKREGSERDKAFFENIARTRTTIPTSDVDVLENCNKRESFTSRSELMELLRILCLVEAEWRKS